MAQYYHDFHLARPGQWPACFKGNVPENSGTKYLSIGPAFQGNPGRMDFVKQGIPDEAYSHHASLGLSVADFDIIYISKMTPVPGTASYVNTGACSVWARASKNPESGFYPASGYLLTNGASTTLGGAARNVRIYKRFADAWTNLGEMTNILPVPVATGNQSVVLRFQGIGTTLRAKAWMEGDAEPGSWGLSVVDTSIASGDIGPSFWGYGQRVSATSIAIGTEGDSPPSPPPLRAVSGTVLTPNSDPAIGYLVNLHDQETGVLLDSSVTNSAGGFSFATTNAGAVYVVAIDQLGNSWRAPIVDRIIPATI